MFDIKSLYTSIPHIYGLEAISFSIVNIQTHYIPDFQQDLYWKVKKQYQKIIIVLLMNFIDKLMGTIFVTTYTTLTMGYFEVHCYNICKLKQEKNFKNLLQKIGVVFQTIFKKPEELFKTLHSVNEAVQFTTEFSDKEIPFLDILIK